MKLVSEIRRYDRKLKKYCKEQMRCSEISSAAVWVTDNYRACSSALKAAAGFLFREGEKDLMPLFFICKEYFRNEEAVSEDRLIAKFSGEKLNIFQCEALSVLLFAAAASVIVDCLGDEGCENIIISCVKNIIRLREIDFRKIEYEINAAEKYLADDPVGIYEKMNNATKKMYLRAVSKTAAKKGISEVSVAKQALADAKAVKQHIGFFLELPQDKRKLGKMYIVLEWLWAISIALLLGFGFIRELYAPLLLVFPVYAAIKPFSDRISSRLFSPYELSALAEDSISDGKTLITVSSLMPSALKAGGLYEHLSELYSTNTKKGVKLMLLLDMKNSKMPEEAGDSADINAVKRLIDRLNKNHGGGFSVAVRDRVFSPTENEYTGFERKRGAIITLCKFLRDKNPEHFSFLYGDTEGLSDMKYILALDSDTLMSFEVLERMLAVAEHPLNEPVFSGKERRIVSGYGIIAPRVETSIESSEKTVFSRIFTNGGSVSYSPQIHERYMDMFGCSIFSGKGLINIDAFNDAVSDKFDEQRILSHDILEGAVLRTAFSAESELTDSFPSSAESYFDRLHRWIRGDLQNLRYIFCPLGQKDAVPSMPRLGKYQLFDNVRRALNPVFSVILLIISCFAFYYDSKIYFFVGLLSIISDNLVSVMGSALRSGMRAFASLYFSSEITSANKDILKLAVNIGSLPQNAAICLDAVLRCAYRCFVSHKKLLSWVTAADAESKTRKNIITGALIPFAVALLFLVFGASYHKLISLLILPFIPLALSGGIVLKSAKEKPLGENERRIILSFAAAQWRFFEENVTASENWLPPDNIQETPVPRRATRTSPTNIGFYLVSVLAAADMSFITGDELIKRIRNTLDSIDKLPKYKGLLYNWYDTVRMTPLYPSYVSSVDCGNYLVCLTALKEGLKEYLSVHPGIDELIKRIEKHLQENDLSLMYDKNRDLFRIGLDCESGELSGSFYDLYMSEARMTSYYECAKRHVPARHWRALDRTLKRAGSYVTAASWTGTMFEYFLPVLFLGNVRNSFQYEALKVCLFMQKKRAEQENIPYGISESCFYAVDSELNYRYKAHGIKKLALKRGADDDSVISPYSVFLTLPFDRKAAMKNLGKLSALHLEGRYGFYEAADFTRSRTEGEDYAIVRCYMSHHVGMSIVAMANTLFDGIFVKRFMSDKDMRSAKVLLSEKIPEHPTRVRDFGEKLFKVRQKKKASSDFTVSEAPEAFAYSNGDVTVLCDKYGRNRTVYAASDIFKFSEGREGINIGVETENEIIPLFSPIDGEVKLKKYGATYKKSTDGLEFRSAVCVHPTANAVLIPVKITNTSEEERHVTVHYYAEPGLLSLEKEDEHTAFSDMFLKISRIKKQRALVFYRNNSHFSPALALGFYGKNMMNYNLDRETVIERSSNGENVFLRNYRFKINEIRGVSPVAAICTEVDVLPGKSTECVLIAALGCDESDALFSLNTVRNRALPLLSGCACATFLRDKLTHGAALDVIARTFFCGSEGNTSLSAKGALKKGINALWELGISGDFPIITVFAEKNCPVMMQQAFIRLYKRFAKSSISSDLVFIFDKTADYGFTGERDLRRIIADEAVEDCIGKRGGIHILYKGAFSDYSFNAILAFSKYVYPNNDGESKINKLLTPFFSKTEALYDGENGFSENGYQINSHPEIAWSHTLSNNTFGTLITDKSLGYTFCGNSRLNKLTCDSHNTADDFFGERLYLSFDEKVYDIIENASVEFSDTFAKYSIKAGSFNVMTLVEVPEKGNRKRITVIIKNCGDDKKQVSLFYSVIPLIAESTRYEGFVKIQQDDDGIYAENPMNEDYKGIMYMWSENKASMYSSGGEKENANRRKRMLILQKFDIDAKKSIQTDFSLCFADSLLSAKLLAKTAFKRKTKKKYAFNTGFPFFDEFSSALLYNQVSDTRLRARCGYYQCSGAFGYRDQLQDILPLIGRDNKTVRQMIYRAASAQFPEGDVLHWFHVMYKNRLIYKGIRTHCSDDMLWLPFAVSEYVSKTGDVSILDKKIPYLQGERLKAGQKDAYGEYLHSEKYGDVYSHCLAALGVSLKTGEHSLPLFGGGDWNDSFDLVGTNGKGESVWLSMFMKKVFADFSRISRMKNDADVSLRLFEISEKLATVTDEVAWNGEWYIRGFYDDGASLGDKNAESCEIDLLCQAWSSLSDMPRKDRVKTALLSAYERLFDEENGVVKLFWPPFTENSKKTGYVNLYPEGMRENGGQYSHAAVWFCMALFKEGLTVQAEKVLRAIIPSVKYADGKGERYKTEPYSMAGDVYSAVGHMGRGGWSLYTGSAGWLLQLADILSAERNQPRENRN